MNPVNKLGIGGVYTFEHIRGGKVIDNKVVGGEVIDTWSEKNIVVDEGLAYILGVAFDGSTSALTSWYIGLFSGNYTPVNTTTAANITANATEITTAYSEATRVAWVEAGVTARLIGNAASPALFTFTAATTNVYGAFLASASAKGATTGTLSSAKRFAALKTMLITDILSVTYEITATST